MCSPSKVQEAPDDVGDNLVLLLEWTRSDLWLLSCSLCVFIRGGRDEAEFDVNC